MLPIIPIICKYLKDPERLSPSQGTYPGWPSASERIRRLIKFAALAEPTMPKSCMASDMDVLNPGNAAESCIRHPHCPGTPNHFATSGQSLGSPEISVGKWEAAPVRTLPGELQINQQSLFMVCQPLSSIIWHPHHLNQGEFGEFHPHTCHSSTLCHIFHQGVLP